MRRIETHFASLVSAGVDNVVGALEFRAAERPDHPACILLERGEHALAPLTYAALWSAARRVAAVLCVRAAPGARVLLAFPAGGDFVIALFACFLAGMIAAPCPPPTLRLGGQRLAAIAADCDARLLLTQWPQDNAVS